MKYGCTTCFDHHYVFPNGAGDLLAAQFSAAEALGMRMVSSRGSMSLSRKDDGDCRRTPSCRPRRRFCATAKPPLSATTTLRIFSMRQVVLAPLLTVFRDGGFDEGERETRAELWVRLHTHLCETKDEERFTENTRGMRPLAYMESVDFVGSDVFYAHGIYFNDQELQFLADTGYGRCALPLLQYEAELRRRADSRYAAAGRSGWARRRRQREQ